MSDKARQYMRYVAKCKEFKMVHKTYYQWHSVMYPYLPGCFIL